MSEYAFFDHHPKQADLLQDVLGGLSEAQKTLSPKFFYDEAGSKLFEEITRLPEYYLTRTELGIFDAFEQQMREALDHTDCIVEYGSGSNLKIRRLLEIARPSAYVPLDISSAHLQDNARALHRAYPEISVYPVCADFTGAIELPPQVSAMQKTGFFPGSSIGNFEPRLAAGFLANIAETVGAGGQLLIGVDCKKPAEILEPAYDDAQGVTAAFNLNMLKNLNDQLGSNFDVSGFTHRATYNEEAGRIEMYLVARRAQTVAIGDATVAFRAGEEIHTENSYKYAVDEFLSLSASAGFRPVEIWQDEQKWFAIYLLEAAQDSSTRSSM